MRIATYEDSRTDKGGQNRIGRTGAMNGKLLNDGL
jgi:hypothetical protein